MSEQLLPGAALKNLCLPGTEFTCFLQVYIYIPKTVSLSVISKKKKSSFNDSNAFCVSFHNGSTKSESMQHIVTGLF